MVWENQVVKIVVPYCAVILSEFVSETNLQTEIEDFLTS